MAPSHGKMKNVIAPGYDPYRGMRMRMLDEDPDGFVPHFDLTPKDETLHEFAKRLLPQQSRKKLNAHALYEVDVRTSVELITPLFDSVRGQPIPNNVGEPEWLQEASTQQFIESITNLPRWAKTSFFRIWVGWVRATPGLTDDYVVLEPKGDIKQYLCGVAIGRVNEMIRTSAEYRGWGIHAFGMRQAHPDEAEKWDSGKTKDIKFASTIAATAVGLLVGRLMDRPHEFRLSKGIRTNRERVLNYPTVVTISLSAPIVQTIGNGNGGGGWHMPEHDVVGHWQCIERGKAMAGCHHSPVLRDGDFAICERCHRLIKYIPEHKRGDPTVQRKTTYRVIP